MKFAALISGGKDSTFNILECLHEGHELVALINLCPSAESGKDELDSYMYQTVGHEAIDTICKAIGDVKVYRSNIDGTAVSTSLQYTCNDINQYDNKDEVEDLYKIISKVKNDIPDLQAISSGAILSTYQRTRVENVCLRLNLISLAFMWQRSQPELLQSMLDCKMSPVLVKIAALGLTEKQHLGKLLKDVHADLILKSQLYGLNPCGEGGEYETLTLDAPFFQKSIEIVSSDVVTVIDDSIACVKYLKIKKLKLHDKKVGTYCYSADFYKSELCHSLPLKSVSNVDSIKQELSFEISEMMEQTCAKNYQGRGLRLSVMSGFGLYDNGDDHELSASNSIRDAVVSIEKLLTENGLDKTAIVYCVLCVHDMKMFSAINRAYCEHFPATDPPPRTCIQATAASNIISLHCLIDLDRLYIERRYMHIRSLSHWAPANIGPYSQAVVLVDGDEHHCLLSGQIAMHPETLDMICDDRIEAECLLCLRHVSRVVWRHGKLGWSDLRAMVCYSVCSDDLIACRALFHNVICKQTLSCVCDRVAFVQVHALPKNARVEWQASFSSCVTNPDTIVHNNRITEPSHSFTYSTLTSHHDLTGFINIQSLLTPHKHNSGTQGTVTINF